MLACIKFAKCRPDARIPIRENGSAGLDIYACFDEPFVMVPPHGSKMIPTGIKSAMDDEWFILIEERSSTGSKGIKRSCSVIDGNFRGEWHVCIYNSTDKPLFISKNINEFIEDENSIQYPYSKAIAQGLVLPVIDIDWEEWSESEVMNVPSMRGDGMMGSTGK